MTRAERLRAFAERMDGQVVVWGESDCTAAPAQWLRGEGHPIELPAYGSREEAQAIVTQYGSLADSWDALVGLPHRVGEPHVGDVAVIETRRYGQIGGICAAGNILLIRTDAGSWNWFGPVRSFVQVWALPES